MKTKIFAVAAILSALLLTSCTSTNEETSPGSTTELTSVPAASTTTTTSGPSDVIIDGTSRVGIDILPGTYQFDGSKDSCYWERLSGFSGTSDDIIANDNPRGQAFVTIEESDKAFQSNRCGFWLRVDDPEPDANASGNVENTITPAATPAAPVAPAAPSNAPVPAPPAPTFVQCWENNAALLSDGSIVTDTVNCQLEAPDDSQIPIADGGTCPAYLCGYGTNDQGQRNPSSGEIQTFHGCQEGYINDPALCEAVAWVETHQY